MFHAPAHRPAEGAVAASADALTDATSTTASPAKRLITSRGYTDAAAWASVLRTKPEALPGAEPECGLDAAAEQESGSCL